jgi:hypothetical protein
MAEGIVSAKVVKVDGVSVPKHNFAATVDPTVNDDSGAGYSLGSVWVNATSDTAFTCVDASVGAAVWSAGGGGGGNTPQQQILASQVITGTNTALSVPLSATPVSNASVKLYINRLFQVQGAGQDYTVSGTTITILAASGTADDLDGTEKIVAVYES